MEHWDASVDRFYQSSCIDVEHKKRGRPRLRDERDQRVEGSHLEHHHSSAPMEPPFVSPVLSSPGRGHQRVGSYRELRSQPGIYHHAHQMGVPMSQSYDLGSFRPSAPNLDVSPIPPIAVLNIDLVIARANNAFHEAIAPGVNLRGRPLLDLVSPSHATEIQGLQSQLRAERDTKDPTYLPPIHGSAHDLDAITSIDDKDLPAATQDHIDRKLYWTFRTSSGQQRNFHFSVKLARTTFFFVVLMLPPGSQYPYVFYDQQRQFQMSPVTSSLARSPVLGQVGQHRPFSSGSSQSGSPYFSTPGSNLSPETRLLANIPRSQHHEDIRMSHPYLPHQPVPPVTSAPGSQMAQSPQAQSKEVGSNPRPRPQDLRHLELPPIHGAAPGTGSGHGQRRTHNDHDGQMPMGEETQHSGHRRRKRQRVGIEEMLD